MEEILRIVGFHLPPSSTPHKDMIKGLFNLNQTRGPLTFQRKMYTRDVGDEEIKKQCHFLSEDVNDDHEILQSIYKFTNFFLQNFIGF